MSSSKLPNVGISIFAEMSKMAADYKALNLSQGFPDFDCSDELKGLVSDAMTQGFNQYAPMGGLTSLREVISRKIETLYGHHYHPEKEICITAGATQALYTAITAFIKEDDEVIVLEPAYDSYVPAIRLSGGRPVFVKLTFPDYSINWEEVQKSITSRTRMIIINTPHNPSGAVFSEEDMLRLQKITSGSRIIILSDEVYEHILFDGLKHHSASKYPELASRSIVVSSFGKIFHTTGWKVGYACAPEKMMAEFMKIHQMIVFAVNHPIQHAYQRYLQNPETYLHLNAFYQKKRDYFVKLLKDSRLNILPAAGTYFLLADFSPISEEKDIEFAHRLTREHQLATIPVSVFYHEKTDNKVVRLCFAKSDETLQKAAEILNRI